jgi:DNA invertase Pin-like site-specific DNA recombinase
MIRERTRAALAAKRAKGERTGTVPMGRVLGAGGGLVPNITELEAVRKARAFRAQGLTLRAISAKLAQERYLARTGRPYDPRSEANMLAA